MEAIGKRKWDENAPQRVHSLDGTRGLAVFLVFFVHYHALFSVYVLPGSISVAVSEFMECIGHTGVDLFFCLSGYLIYGILLQTSPRYSTFLWRRIKRIYPTFLCVLTLYIALSFVFSSRSKLPSSFVAGCIYVLQNVALLPGVLHIRPIVTVSWTLSYEFAFYLSIPLLISLFGLRSWKRQQRIILFQTLILVCVGLSLAMFSGQHLRAVMFAVGIFLREILSDDAFKKKLTRIGEMGAIGFYIVSLGLIYYVRYHPFSFLNFLTDLNVPMIAQVFLTAIGAFVFGLYCFGFDGMLNRLFSWTPIRKLGEISYSYYLFHGLTLNGIALVLMQWLPPSGNSPVLFWTLAPCAFGLTLATATILFVLVEKPFSLARKRSVALPQTSHRPSLVAAVPAADGVSVQRSLN